MAKDPGRTSNKNPTINQEYLDRLLRHQVTVRRFTMGEARKILKMLEDAQADLVKRLRAGLPNTPRGQDDTRQLKRLLKAVRKQTKAVTKSMSEALKSDLKRFAVTEAAFEGGIIEASVATKIILAQPTIASLNKIVTKNSFSGLGLDQWWDTWAKADQARTLRAIQLGVTQGQATDALVRRIVGTRRNKFTDGILGTSRREAEALVRTATNGVSNQARESLWVGNEDIIQALRWVSTLDGRTSAICRANDGHFAPIGEKPLKLVPKLQPPGQRPPIHPQCRSVMSAVLEGDVPDVENYQSWLERQPFGFQNYVLGKTKGRIFRKGKLPLDEFVDESGKELTIDQLEAKHPKEFKKAKV